MRRRRRGLLHVGIAVARAGRRGVAHVVEEDVVRGGGSRVVRPRKGPAPSVKVQVETLLQTLPEGIRRKAPGSLMRLVGHHGDPPATSRRAVSRAGHGPRDPRRMVVLLLLTVPSAKSPAQRGVETRDGAREEGERQV